MDAVDLVVASVTVGPVAVDLRVAVGAGADVGRTVMAGMVRGDSAGSSSQNVPPEPPGLPAAPHPALCLGRDVAAPADTPATLAPVASLLFSGTLCSRATASLSTHPWS